MSLLIADIGGTASRWALIETSGAVMLPGPLPGFNPVSGDPGALQTVLEANGSFKDRGSRVDELVVYGAGCGSEARKARMREVLQPLWPSARITVETDLLGAARGLYGNDAGLVLILGTGMNAGYYDGRELHTPMPSLGYVLGDECSGADIGKHLLRDHLYGRIPKTIDKLIFPERIEVSEVVQAVYRDPAPQAWLAAFAARVAELMDDDYIRALVQARVKALAVLLAHFFTLEERAEVRASGSVAFGLWSLLEAGLAGHGMRLSAVERNPMPGLLAFHSGLPR